MDEYTKQLLLRLQAALSAVVATTSMTDTPAPDNVIDYDPLRRKTPLQRQIRRAGEIKRRKAAERKANNDRIVKQNNLNGDKK